MASLLRAAAALNPRHAGVNYHLGTCLGKLGRFDEARASYIRARDEDICALRATEAIHAAILDVAEETRTPVVDARRIFASRAGDGIPGDELLLDHVHPSFEGHQIIADAVLREMVTAGLLDPAPGWEDARRKRYEEHLAGLDAVYYRRAQERMDRLRLWTKGRAMQIGTASEPAE
jgi:hypothetical protein